MNSDPRNLESLGIPHLDQYSGVWAMHAPSAATLQGIVASLDINEHVKTYREAAKKQEAEPRYHTTDNGAAIVDLSGTMTKYGSSLTGTGGTVSVRRAIREAADDPKVRAIVLRVHSPGGSVFGTSDLADDVRAVAQSKPVVAYAEDLVASAAYWVAAQANAIVANSTAEIGSIGVYTYLDDYSAAFAKEGVKRYLISSGKFKGMGLPGTEVTADVLAEEKRIINSLHTLFVGSVALGRKLDPLYVMNQLADGRVHVGQDAVSLKLVDSLGSLEDAVRAALSLVKGNMSMSDTNKNAETDRLAAEKAAADALAKTQADAKATIDAAVKAANERASKITALCRQAKQADLADAFIVDSSLSVGDVSEKLLAKLCEANKPIGDGGATTEPTGENAKYKAEYAANAYLKAKMSEADYISTRRIDDGLDKLVNYGKKTAA